MTHEDLINELEQATCPSFVLDGRIQHVLVPGRDDMMPPNYSASVDAALRLFDNVIPKTAGNLRVVTDIRLKANGMTFVQIFSHSEHRGHDPRGEHRYPAMALCIAIAKARRDMEAAE